MHVLGLQQQLPGSSYVSMTAALPMLRAIKDADEIELLRRRRRRADAGFEEIDADPVRGPQRARRRCRPRRPAARVRPLEVDFTLVGPGPNGANPHHEVGAAIIEEGDMVVLDFGGLKHGYGSDTTRTVHVGEPTAEEREVHDVVAPRAAGRLRGRAAGRRPARRSIAPRGRDHRRRLRRPLHPPHRARHRADDPRAAVHGRGRDPARSSPACASRSSPGSTCPGSSASGSRTS